MRDAARDVGEEDSVIIVVVVGVTVNVDNVVSISVSTSATAGGCLVSRGRRLLRRQVQIAQHWVRAAMTRRRAHATTSWLARCGIGLLDFLAFVKWRCLVIRGQWRFECVLLSELSNLRLKCGGKTVSENGKRDREMSVSRNAHLWKASTLSRAIDLGV